MNETIKKATGEHTIEFSFGNIRTRFAKDEKKTAVCHGGGRREAVVHFKCKRKVRHSESLFPDSRMRLCYNIFTYAVKLLVDWRPNF
jgi:hypothetical protein